jgi:hypothetical protein
MAYSFVCVVSTSPGKVDVASFNVDDMMAHRSLASFVCFYTIYTKNIFTIYIHIKIRPLSIDFSKFIRIHVFFDVWFW